MTQYMDAYPIASIATTGSDTPDGSDVTASPIGTPAVAGFEAATMQVRALT